MKNKNFKHQASTKIAMILYLLLVLTVIALSESVSATPQAGEVTLHISKRWNDVATYTLTYDPYVRDALSFPQVQTAYAGTAIRISGEIPTRSEGLSQFLGWAFVENAHTADYLPGDEILMDSDITLYGAWEPVVIPWPPPEITPGSIITGFPIDVTANRATLIDNTYEGDFGGAVTQVGVQYSQNFNMTDSMCKMATAETPFNTEIEGLSPDTIYYYRAIVITGADDSFFGIIKSFTTAPRT